jgi:phosphatidylinositol N-acetylglucosaminyltransferase subunit Q
MQLGGIRFELRNTQQISGISQKAHAAPPTSYIFLKVSKPPSVELSPSNNLQSVPLTFRAMFHQYFQLGHRIRKHYLSPRVLLCLATGKFVPPIHRKNLYSLQYSMLPAHRAGITEMWHALTAQTPAKKPGLYDNLKVNGKRLNSGGRRHYGHWDEKGYFLVYNVKMWMIINGSNSSGWERTYKIPTSQCDQMKLKHIFMYTVFETYIS